MKPSHHRAGYKALLRLIPISIYVATMGWKFGLALLGFIFLGAVVDKLANKILPEPVKGKS